MRGERNKAYAVHSARASRRGRPTTTQQCVRRSQRARVTSRPTDHGARTSRRDRPTDHRRRRRRAHGVGRIGVRDGGSEWRRGGRTRWGGRSAHEKRVTSHHAVRRTDGWRGGWRDGQTDRRRTDGRIAPSSLPCTASAAAVAAAEVHARRTCGGGEWFQRVRKQSGRRVEALFGEV